MIIMERYDDLDYARDKTKTLADHLDVPLTWKNKVVTLDLSEENYSRLSDMLDTVVKAGKAAETGKAPRTPAGRKSAAHGRRTAAYYESLRKFTDDNRISKRDGSGRPAYEGQNGRNDYPDWLIVMYDEHLAKTSQAA